MFLNKAKQAQDIFTGAMKKAIRETGDPGSCIVIECDEDYTARFAVSSQGQKSPDKTISQLLNTYDYAMVSMFKIDLKKEISLLLQRYCESLNIHPLSISVYLLMSRENIAVPILYNGAEKIRVLDYQEFFEKPEDEEIEEIKIEENEISDPNYSL